MTAEQDAGPGLTLARVAELCGGRIGHGDPEQRITGIAALDLAEGDQLALLTGASYLDEARASGAGALLVSNEMEERIPEDRARVVVDDAHAALIPVLEALHPLRQPAPGVHPSAVLGRGVRLGADVTVGAYAVLEDDAVLGDRVRVGPHAVLGPGVLVGDDSVLHAHVVLYPGTVVGERVVLHAGVRLGVDGFGYAWVEGGHRKVPQVGRCVIADDVEIGANTTVDRGSIGDTTVGRGTKIDNLVHLAHNVRMGPHCAVAALVGIAGSTRVGTGVLFAGQVGVAGHLKIGDGARLAAAAKLWRDLPEGETYAGAPARPLREHLKSLARLERLPGLTKRVQALERDLADLRASVAAATDEDEAGDVEKAGP
jgi:UDP-3-O-[3-hydroxymyristoyl] glucosamine N-acyltransferase